MSDIANIYTDLNFVDTDTSKLVNKMVQGYEQIIGRKLYPADPIRLFILWVADIIIQERVNINISAQQNTLRGARNEYLDILAELFKDATRLPPAAARTTLRFTLSEIQPYEIIVEEETRATVDGLVTFATTKKGVIPAGELSVDIPAVCIDSESDDEFDETEGNGFLPGQINQPVDQFEYLDTVENITESAGGFNSESDAAFYVRISESIAIYSIAGPAAAYEYLAKSASALIADAKAESPEPGSGIVDVRILLQGGEIPGEEIINLVTESLSAALVRPLTDFVVVSAPDQVTYDIDFTYYLQDGIGQNADYLAEKIQAAVDEYIEWQSEKMGRDINPSELLYRIKQTGIKRAEIRSPEFIPVPKKKVAVIGTQTVDDGGYEDE